MTKSIHLLIGAVIVAGVAGRSMAGETTAASKATYLRYCSACHGEAAKGDGVVSQLMNPKPTDLTLLAKRNKGEFPFLATMRAIDGRETIRAHGDFDMPVWGEIFRSEDGQSPSQQAQIRGKVMLITEYLSDIQEK